MVGNILCQPIPLERLTVMGRWHRLNDGKVHPAFSRGSIFTLLYMAKRLLIPSIVSARTPISMSNLWFPMPLLRVSSM